MIFDILLTLLGGVFLLAGLVGCIIPVVPGPVLAWLSLVALGFTGGFTVTPVWIVVATGIAAVVSTILDNILPARASHKAGAARPGVIGSVVGMIAGSVFFPPLGIFLGAFFGALLGEVLFHRENERPLSSALAVFRGTFLAIILKIAVVGWIGVVFIRDAIRFFSG